MTTKLLKKQRIKKKVELTYVRREKNILTSHCFLAFYCSNELSYPRLGVVTYKKNVKTAVLRNRLKRIAREAFRLRQSQLLAIDIVIVSRNVSKLTSPQKIRQCIEQIFTKLIVT